MQKLQKTIKTHFFGKTIPLLCRQNGKKLSLPFNNQFLFQVEKPVRKSAGLLLETAGKSLLQRRMPPAATAADRKFNSLLGLGGANSGGLGNSSQPAQLSFGLAPEKISFGLYDGNLAVEAASGNFF